VARENVSRTLSEWRKRAMSPDHPITIVNDPKALAQDMEIDS
jgi:hypothetical protein